METLGLGDGHHSTAITGRIHSELEGGIGLNLHKKGGELCFRHAEFGFDYKQTLEIFLEACAKAWLPTPGRELRANRFQTNNCRRPGSSRAKARPRWPILPLVALSISAKV